MRSKRRARKRLVGRERWGELSGDACVRMCRRPIDGRRRDLSISISGDWDEAGKHLQDNMLW